MDERILKNGLDNIAQCTVYNAMFESDCTYISLPGIVNVE